MSAESQTDGKAIGSLICGIASVTILSILAGIPAMEPAVEPTGLTGS